MTLNQSKAASLFALALLSSSVNATNLPPSAETLFPLDSEFHPEIRNALQDPQAAVLNLAVPGRASAEVKPKEKIDTVVQVAAFKKLEPAWSPQRADEKLAASDLWARLRGGFGIADLNDAAVSRHILTYTAHPEYFDQSTQRASKYLYHIVSEVERRKMPTELALLPFVESSFNPQALSPAKASGMWQFIPSTGTNFKLKQNVFKDERRDIVASTNAALDYLEYLHDMFGDWQLALAAYNWGEGSVQKLIRNNEAAGRATDYASMSSQMPAETRNYVPRLLAYKEIVSNPGKYGVSLPALSNTPYFTAVEKSRDMDVSIAAQLADMPVDEFRALNPQFNRPVITGSDTRILVPTTRVETFRTNLTNWKQRLSSWTVHTVASAKDKIEAIAKRFGTTPEKLRAANQIPARMQVSPGSTLLVPKMSASIGTDTEIRADVADNARIGLAKPRVESRHAKHEKSSRGHKSRYRSRD